MALRELVYQNRVLTRLDDYLNELAIQKKRADKIAAANVGETDPDLIRPVPNFALQTWEAMRAAGKLPESRQQISYSSRADGCGRAVPNVIFKVPTGGGKTYLAVSALSKIFGRYLGQQKGFVLWVVPNEAIYAQTKRQLADRQHPFRQMLDTLAGGKVRLLEKTDALNASDVESNLCVMLLMLQASNRENKDSLKMFRDRGDVNGFFPPEGDQEAHTEALKQTPNLDSYDLAGSAYAWTQVKDSLGNALRLIRPVVVMDEGHKAISDLAFSTLYGFNPCFVLELTATPKDAAATGGKAPKAARHANVLVEVKGIELDREGMIKMPMNLDPREGSDWRQTLAVALNRIKALDHAARQLQADTGRYIRPILLVQVERTGSDQRDGVHIHALDVKEWLMTVGGLDEAEIAVKTADTNDLATPENQDLLAPTNRVQVIITKSALQEGWDCPFAYVLCALAASSNLSAMTQLIGRILRQPQAQKTGVAALDECYVIAHHANTSDVVNAIKKGLEDDGMGDLVRQIHVSDAEGDGGAKPLGARPVQRREKFSHTEIYLPRLLTLADGQLRDFDYEQDILLALDWPGLDVAPLVALIPVNAASAEHQMRRIHLTDSGTERIVSEVAGATLETLVFDAAYAVRMLSDMVPNAWWARDIVGKVLAGLKAKGISDARLGELSSLVIEELRKWLATQRNAKAEALFRAEVAAGRIQFRLRTDGRNWRMPLETQTFEPVGAPQLIRDDGESLKSSLFAPLYAGDFSSSDEREIAVYLDADRALTWWHRNVARSHYALQGWQREKIYPDFIFAVQHGELDSKLVVLEMKGIHLSGNPDTVYKQSVLQLMTEAFSVEKVPRVGELELVVEDGTRMACDLVLMTEWKTRLPLFSAKAGK
ncbi:MAG: DEAD/DEAH box helicase family protein [Burkholderiales bacterium]|nr:DEAD/DEAH box helicase family protein [Burkholderiales bacterium]